jgi:hypothetical protein
MKPEKFAWSWSYSLPLYLFLVFKYQFGQPIRTFVCMLRPHKFLHILRILVLLLSIIAKEAKMLSSAACQRLKLVTKGIG